MTFLHSFFLRVQKHQKCIVLSGITAAEKIIAARWKPPHTLTVRQWALTFLDVVYMESATARINGAKEVNVNMWLSAADTLKDLL